jgi:hypothetical protein
VKDELWGDNLIEGVGVPRAPEFPYKFVETPDDGLVLFRDRGLLSLVLFSTFPSLCG